MIENRTIITSEYSTNKRKLLKSILLIRVLLTFIETRNFFCTIRNRYRWYISNHLSMKWKISIKGGGLCRTRVTSQATVLYRQYATVLNCNCTSLYQVSVMLQRRYVHTAYARVVMYKHAVALYVLYMIIHSKTRSHSSHVQQLRRWSVMIY